MRKYERGQILLIVVLVMTIALTIGLSIATRTITDVRTSTEQDTSQRAFSAAEAGIEKALQEVSGSEGEFTNDASYQTTVTAISGMNLLLNNGNPILKNDTGDIWLSTYPGYTSPRTGDISIYWGNAADTCTQNPATNSMAALEIVVISGTKADPILTHYPVDPCSARVAANRFELILGGGATIEGKQFRFRKTIFVTSGLLVRIIPLYASTTIAVRGCNATGTGGSCIAFPSQGKLITSVGTSDTTQRKIVGIQENPKLPVQIFPYILFSPR